MLHLHSTVILDLRLTGKSHDYCEVIVLNNVRFQNVFCLHKNERPAFSNSSGLKSVYEKLRFRDGLLWMVPSN